VLSGLNADAPFVRGSPILYPLLAMDATIKALQNLVVESIPTIVFFIFLYFFLRQVFFRPMARILEERHKATEGVRALSEQAFAQADQKTGEFERALELARQEISAENEKIRQQWAAEAAEATATARKQSESQLAQAKQEIQTEVAQADEHMENQIESIIQTVIRTALGRRAA
jgi:F-type H+-transporting ATPase subunit b